MFRTQIILNCLFLCVLIPITSCNFSVLLTSPEYKEYYELLASRNIIEKFPVTKYVASIKHTGLETSYAESHLCTGIIITKWAIVSAAHCLLNESNFELYPEDLSVVGAFKYGSLYESGLQERTLQRTILHPDFKRKTYESDLAILVPSEKFVFQKDVIEPVRISSKQVSTKDACYVFGFGIISFREAKLSHLIKHEISIWPKDECASYLKQYKIHTEGKFCAGNLYGPKGPPCEGFASEPLICDNRAYGIALFNIGCKSGNRFAAVYAQLSDYKDWIASYRESHELLKDVQVKYLPSNFNILLCLAIVLVNI